MRPLAPMLGLLVAFGCTRAQPRASAKPWPGRCELPQQRAPAHVTHDDYRRLLPFRPYVRVAQVGPWADHVTVWFGCIEANVARFEVSPRGDLKLLGSAWGGVAVEPKDVPAVPAEGRAAVDRVRAWFAEVAPDASISRARYDGRYRRVTLVGLVPFDPAGPQRRMGAAATLTFGASEDLTRVVGPAASGISSDEGFLCSAGECGEPPKWLSLESPAGTLAAMRAARRDPGASPFVRDALEQIRLGRSPSLDAILSNQDASDAIPREGLPRVEVSLRLFGKGPHATVPTDARIPIDVRGAAGGVASGEASVAWDGQRVRLRARLSIDAPNVEGALRGPMRLEVEIDDERDPSLAVQSLYDGVGVADRGRFALAAVSPRADTARGDRALDAARTRFVSAPALAVDVE